LLSLSLFSVFLPLSLLCCSDAATTYRRHGKNTWYGILPTRSGRDNIFVLRERRATSCLLFRPRSALSVYSETSASHETVCLPFPYSFFSVPMRHISSPRVLFVPVFIYLFASMSLYFRLPISFAAIVPLFFPRVSHACLRFSFIKLIASTKPKKHVVWGVTREYRVASTETSTARDSRWAMPSIGLTGHRYAPLWHSIGESLETVWIMWFVWWIYLFLYRWIYA